MRNYHMEARGLGSGSGSCLVCGHAVGNGTNFASFVSSKEIGEAIVNLFDTIGVNCYLDFRPSEPGWIQIKIVGCRDHTDEVVKLFNKVNAKNFIDAEMIVTALGEEEKFQDEQREAEEDIQPLRRYKKPEWAVTQVIREEGLVEDVCIHGVGHPNKQWLQENPLIANNHVHACCIKECCTSLDK